MSKWYLIERYWFYQGMMHSVMIDGVLAPCADMALAEAMDRNSLRPQYGAIDGVTYSFRANWMVTKSQIQYAMKMKQQRDIQLIDAMPVDEFCQWMESPAYSGGVQ